jgi:hypothetical protein
VPAANKKVSTREIVIGSIRYPSKRAAAVAYGISPQLFGRRMAKGLTVAQALGIEPPPDWFIPGKGQFARERARRRVEQEQETGLRKCRMCKCLKPLTDYHKYVRSSLKNGGGKCKECTARCWLKYRYNIEPDLFFDMVKQQKGLCAICQADLDLSTESARRRSFAAVDHCHETGEVRGLLCHPCNAGMGLLRDSAERLRRAAEYLENFQAKQQSVTLAA